MKALAPLLLLGLLAACVNREIVKPAEHRTLAAGEIAAGLVSPSFRDVLAAREQLKGLPDDVWFAAISPLAHAELPQHRLLAVVELSRRPLVAARTLLTELVLDPDEAVRNEAAERLAVAPPPGGGP